MYEAPLTTELNSLFNLGLDSQDAVDNIEGLLALQVEISYVR